MILPSHIVTRLDHDFHGQAEVKRAIGIAIAAGINGTGVTPRLLICGPSGTGKTSMVVSVAGDFLQPVVVAPITAYTQTGYVGKDVSSILEDLVVAAYKLVESVEQSLPVVGKMDGAAMSAIGYLKMFSIIPHDLLDKFVSKVTASVKKDLAHYTLGYNAEKDAGRQVLVLKCLKMVPDGYSPTANWVEVIKGVLTKVLKKEAKVKKGTSIFDVVKDSEMLPTLHAIGMVFPVMLREHITANFDEYVKHFTNRGVVILDEIDKIADNGDRSNVGRVGVQRDLLTLLDATGKSTYKCADIKKAFSSLFKDPSSNDSGPSLPRLTSDFVIYHSKVCFIAAGAFVEERLDGIMDELRGRFHFITRTYDFDKTAMRAIVEKDIEVFNKTANAAGLELVLDDDAKDAVAEEAVALNSNRSTGARRITNILSALLLLKAHENHTTRVMIFNVGVNEVRMAVNEIKRSTYWQEKGQIGFSA